jgi:hypothetical protein
LFEVRHENARADFAAGDLNVMLSGSISRDMARLAA